ncbi:hypothetical protein [Lacrimispora sp.]|uniref:hypothetical protein n=1 Tax=Lacrimispora sp. TaxID=2719234 RepID=UPI0034601DB6
MEELLKAILLENVSDKAKKVMEQPIILSFEKGQGLYAEATTKIEGTKTGMMVACITLLADTIGTMFPGCKAMQKVTLDAIYKRVTEKLELK